MFGAIAGIGKQSARDAAADQRRDRLRRSAAVTGGSGRHGAPRSNSRLLRTSMGSRASIG
jgi:hypothetical protein